MGSDLISSLFLVSRPRMLVIVTQSNPCPHGDLKVSMKFDGDMLSPQLGTSQVLCSKTIREAVGTSARMRSDIRPPKLLERYREGCC
jgi:hypothetical protein